MNNFVALEIYNEKENTNLFNNENIKYIIPLYQRAFAWKEPQLEQLIEDINDINADKDISYHLGSLIVAENAGQKAFEVIDGQQRLTALYLLINVLEKETNADSLVFVCRDNSNYTLKNIKALVNKNESQLDLESKLIEKNIEMAIAIIRDRLNKKDIDISLFCKKLGKVVLYRIRVPDNTDLNRYFEIMNTRGEQLEQHDILKADLMSKINDEYKKDAFAIIWNACSDMTGYVQMHFEKDIREKLFSDSWESKPENSLEKLAECLKDKDRKTEKDKGSANILEIAKVDFHVDLSDGFNDDDDIVRFTSIIDFPFFLLHVLRVYCNKYKPSFDEEKDRENNNNNKKVKLIDEVLDDKKIKEAFDRVCDYGTVYGKKIEKKDFAEEFIDLLLLSRYLFDKYIIKREYVKNSQDGEWSLKELSIGAGVSRKNAHYVETVFYGTQDMVDKQSKEPHEHEKIMKLESCLRVSYTSPRSMHWITELLKTLVEGKINMADFGTIIEEQANKDVIDYLNTGKYDLGVSTPNIVFNYLDYLLWKENPKTYSDFNFEFRNSVEHWYPQHPLASERQPWKDVDRFGNLCLVQRNTNSRFSNQSPEAKNKDNTEMIKKGSIKLRKMSELTSKKGWSKDTCDLHEEEMIKKLKNACEAFRK